MDQLNSNREKVATAFFRRSRAANSVVRSRIWPNFNLTQALMYVVITCKYEKDMNEKTWQHRFSHYESMEIFSLKGNLLCSRWSDLAELRTPSSSHAFHHSL